MNGDKKETLLPRYDSEKIPLFQNYTTKMEFQKTISSEVEIHPFKPTIQGTQNYLLW